MLRDADVLSLLMSRKPNHSLVRELYTDSGAFQVDLERIWYQNWLFAAPACDLPKAGSYITYKVGDYEAIIVRGNDKKIRAFHNTCRHRGSIICKERKGTSPNLRCPYHQWTYGLDGNLVWTKDMGADFDPKAHGLKTVHVREVAGLIYICFAAIAPAFDAFAEKAEKYFGPYDLTNAKVAHESTIIEGGNWKLVWENNRECYHCGGNHPSLCRTYSDDPSITASSEDGTLSPFMADYMAKMDAAGIPGHHVQADDASWRFVRNPLTGTAVSYTLSGKAASAKPIARLPEDGPGVLMKYNYPSTWNHFLRDHCVVFRVTPISPTETEVTTRWLVHKDAEEGVDYDLKTLTEVWEATNDEDRRVVEDNQRGINSPAYEPGPYSHIQEEGVITFVNWYADTLTRSMTGKAVIAAE